MNHTPTSAVDGARRQCDKALVAKPPVLSRHGSRWSTGWLGGGVFPVTGLDWGGAWARGRAHLCLAGIVAGLMHLGGGRCVAAVLEPPETAARTTIDAPATNPAATNTAFVTMPTLDDTHKLALGDKLSFRIIEDQVDPTEKSEPRPLIVADHGDVEVPYIGRFPAVGKTCRQLAREIKTELEKEYYYQATVIIGLDLLAKSVGRVYVLGEVRAVGAVEMPGDETLTAGKAVLRAGGFTNYADKRRVQVTRKANLGGGKPRTWVVNLVNVLEKGKADLDLNVEPGDVIYVPTRLINF